MQNQFLDGRLGLDSRDLEPSVLILRHIGVNAYFVWVFVTGYAHLLSMVSVSSIRFTSLIRACFCSSYKRTRFQVSPWVALSLIIVSFKMSLISCAKLSRSTCSGGTPAASKISSTSLLRCILMLPAPVRSTSADSRFRLLGS